MRSSARTLLIAAALHLGAAGLAWVLIGIQTQIPGAPPGFAEILAIIAIVGLIAQIAFATISALGFVFLRRGGTDVMAWGTGLLVVGVIAAVFSIAVFGGFLGLIGGIATAYAGNKLRKPPRPQWIPPSSWMPSTPPPSR